MRLSRASDYALHALARLAGEQAAAPVASHVLAGADGSPERFLLKLFKPLVSAGVLRSVRGPGGGYRLARPADRVTLLEVVEAIEGPVRGAAPPVGGPLDARLQAVCDAAAGLTRQALAKVRLSDLAGAARGGRKGV